MVVYIHIPFCNSICSYCDFCKIYYNKKYIYKYLDALKKEIDERYKNDEITSIFIGGGTPSSLEEDELIYLFEILKIFDTSNLKEFTIECNPESITLEKLKIMKKYGVNRISIGVQSFDDEVLKILGRSHSKREVFDKVNLVKKYFDNINIDLIYAVTSDISKVKKDIDYFLKLDIPHVSCYSLIIEDGTILKNNNYKNIDTDIDYEMYKLIDKTLTSHGYVHYEISNYVKNGYESLHNLTYWNNDSYYGFGLSSVSYLENRRISNTFNLNKYLSGDYVMKVNYEDKKVRMENEIMLGFRKVKGINLKRFKERYGITLQEAYDINELLNDGILILSDDYLRINDDFIYVSNEIIARIIN